MTTSYTEVDALYAVHDSCKAFAKNPMGPGIRVAVALWPETDFWHYRMAAAVECMIEIVKKLLDKPESSLEE